MSTKSTILKILSISVLLIATGAAKAQGLLEEIVVTATKRQQTLQEVPVAVTVTTAETIEQARILDILDLQSVVPSLRVGQLQNSASTNFIIRGFGNGANNAGIEPSVGVFIDGVYRSRSAAQIADLPNIERVEVLRGPQSTLFGKNASAGVISIVTKKPQFETEGFIEGGISNYSGTQVKGYVTGPVSDKVAYSIGATYNERDGYTRNLALGTDVSDRNRWSLRGELLFEPNETSSYRFSIDTSNLDERCCSVANLVSGPTAGAIALLGGQLDNENPFSYNVFQNRDPRQEVDNGGISLHADWELGNHTLTSITAYRDVELRPLSEDVDFSSADLIASTLPGVGTEISTFTQELRLASNYDGPVNFLVGAYYFDEEIDGQGGIAFGPRFRDYADILTGAPGTIPLVEFLLGFPFGTFYAPGDGTREFTTQDNQAFSLFGTLDWDITDRMTATIGLNYTDDEKEVTLRQDNTDVFSNLPLDLFGLGALSGLQFLPQLLEFPNIGEDGRSNDTNTDVTLRLAYDLTDNVNVYASYATGFKSTSWNLSRDSRPTVGELNALIAAGQPLPFNLVTGTRQAGPEEAEVVELGLKAQFERGSLNLAVFDQTLEDFQFNAFTGAAFTLANAGETNVQGLEIDALYFPTDNLSLGFAATFLDPVYESFPLSASGDLSGQEVAGIADTSISLSASYNWTSGEYDGFIRADYQHEADTRISDDPNLTAALEAVGNATREVNLVNISAGFSKGNYEVTVWGRNVFNDEYLISAFPSVAQPGSVSGYPNQPATYGVTLRVNM